MLFYVAFWRKRNYETKLLCDNCLVEIKQSWGVIQEHKMIMFTENLPDDCVPVFLRPPELQDSRDNKTVFEVADRQQDSETTKDRTRLAGRQSWVGIKIGAPNKKLLEDKDKELNLKDGLNVLEDHRKCKPQ